MKSRELEADETRPFAGSPLSATNTETRREGERRRGEGGRG